MMQTCVHIYEEPAAPALDVPQLCEYVGETLPALHVEVREGIIARYLEGQSPQTREDAIRRLAERFARAKVSDPSRPHTDRKPLPGEVDYEIRRLGQPASRTFGLLYDALEMMQILGSLLPREERRLEHIHIVFTNQLFGTWEESDRRYHARVSLYGFPSLLSTTGIVEAPAKPREFYILKQQYAALGMGDATAELALHFKGRCIEHDDPRLTEVMKGYVMQAILYHLWGEPFCEEKTCRLYNAHWQEEVISAQLEGDAFCPYHERRLEELRAEMARQL